MAFVETYSLSHSMELADAIIAATSLNLNESLITGNDKHYKFIPNIKIKKFIP
jgi:predicted nucleic acid-binding protein